MINTEKHNHIIDDELYLNTNDFCRVKSQQSGYFYDIDLVMHKELKYDAIMRNMKGELLYLYKHEILNLTRELNILLQLNHPSILKFYGYGLIDEDQISFCVEYSQIGSLGKIIQLERSKSQINSSSIEFDKEEDVKCKDVDIKDDDNDENENNKDENKNENDENKDDKDEKENDQNGDEDEGENENNEEEEVEENNDSSEDEVNNVTKENNVSENLDNTSIFIIIYGIAVGMEYLHSHNILHRDLKPNNVYISNSIYPKISGFNIAKEIKNNLIEPNEKIKGTPIYIAPEVYLNKGYSKKSDVYSYSLILYELLTKGQPYKDFYSPKEIKEKICKENYRPSFNTPILKCYQDLIEKCWSSNPSDRPTFKEIITELKTNPEFTKNVDKEKLQEYFDFLDESPKTFESSQKIPDLDEFVKRKLYLFKEYNSKINFRSVFDTETNNVSTVFDYCDINDFEKLKTIERNDIYKLCTVQNKKTKVIYIAKKNL